MLSASNRTRRSRRLGVMARGIPATTDRHLAGNNACQVAPAHWPRKPVCVSYM